MTKRPSGGHSLLEVALTTGIIGAGMAILIPVLLHARNEARESQCIRKLSRIAKAYVMYEASHGRFPPGRRLPDWSVNGNPRNSYANYNAVPQAISHRVGHQSVHYWLLPLLDQQPAFDLFNVNIGYGNRMTIGGAPFNVNLAAIELVGPFFVCPDDPNTTPCGISENNYRYNFGGTTPYGGSENTSNQHNQDAFGAAGFSVKGDGAFTIGFGLTAGAFDDGLSKTAFFAERIKGAGIPYGSLAPPDSTSLVTMPGRTNQIRQLSAKRMYNACAENKPAPSEFNFFGAGRWAPGSDYSDGWPFAGYAATTYNHVTPPNWQHIDCGNWSSIPNTPGEHAIVSARSTHGGTVNVSFGDGHVDSISDDIDVAIWRAFGSRTTRTLSGGL